MIRSYYYRILSYQVCISDLCGDEYQVFQRSALKQQFFVPNRDTLELSVFNAVLFGENNVEKLLGDGLFPFDLGLHWILFEVLRSILDHIIRLVFLLSIFEEFQVCEGIQHMDPLAGNFFFLREIER